MRTMAQSWVQFIIGYIHLIIDTLTQKFFDLFIRPDDPVFNKPDALTGKIAIVTGANTGVGYETTKQLSAAGAHVILACRNTSKATDAVVRIRETQPNANLSTELLDLSSLSSVRNFANVIQRKYGGENNGIDMLILNGGVMAVPYSLMEDQCETHMFINHVAHALLSLLLLPCLAKSSSGGRIVFVSSITARISDLRFDDLNFQTRPYQWMTAYANSKLAMILFMNALNLRLRRGNHGEDGTQRIITNAVHPGESSSDVSRYLGLVYYFLHKRIGPYILLPLSHSARTSVYAAGSSSITESGHLLHRVNQKLTIASHLTADEDIERMWRTTLHLAKVTKADLIPLHDLLDTQ